ncbi:hypothetical protein BFP97_19045 [Roseivirga sp. 4D4]|uniref:RNA polymerase sigma factor n=1 Tax=Roseivirga sp. 4D4 TaxID=1889784 RepID=UPI0008531FF8|nr:sigma-70 family RNA polymerase sigma factor [Roseivirga sp. 4D4]OEK03487.1 hypothetical protein BFP97_19045 [Roseivirga sp. 4D4]
MTTKTLIKKCQAGDPKAQKKLYDLYSGMVMFICSRYTNDSESAKDIFQEAFIRIFESIVNTKKIDSLKNWVYTIAVRTSIDALRKKKLTLAEHNGDYDNVNTLTDDHLDILDKLEYQEIMDVVRNMPDGYRLVFNLYLVEGYSHREIGELLDISESTSRSQLTRSKQLLKKYLEEIGVRGYEKAV